MKNICEWCSGPVDRSTRPRSRFCSSECGYEAEKARKRDRYANNPEHRHQVNERSRVRQRELYQSDAVYRERKKGAALVRYYRRQLRALRELSEAPELGGS